MTASELYAMQPQYDTMDVGLLCGFYYNHIPEVGDYVLDVLPEHNKLVVVRVLKEHHIDARRFWRLATVWYDGVPVMVVQNAGREGDDHHARFITDVDQYTKMIGYLWSIKSNNKFDTNELIDPEHDNSLLDYFYGHGLNSTFTLNTF